MRKLMTIVFVGGVRIIRGLQLAKSDRLRRVSVRMVTDSVSRPSGIGLGVDLRSIKESPQTIKAHLRDRGADEVVLGSVDRLGELSAVRRDLSKRRDDALAARKSTSAVVGQLLKSGKDATSKREEASKHGEVADGLERQLQGVEAEVNILLNRIPNLLDDRTPYGVSEQDNVLVSTWGKPKHGEYRWHDEIALELGGLEGEAASKMSGARFAFLKGQVARLERALASFFVDTAVANGYTECRIPYIVGRSALEGTGQLPKFEDDLFRLASHEVAGSDAFLIPTAEVPLTNVLAGKLLEESELPVRLTAWTPCFRAEAGSYGRDVRGLIRQHQFDKVELVSICTADRGRDEHEMLTQHAEQCLQALGLPYRKMLLCSADLGFSAQICYDLEVWLPGQKAYREISSCSLVGDFQARRMGLRYRPSRADSASGNKKAKPVFASTINGSALAVGRALVAVLENYQNLDDGSVDVPVVLQPYLNGLTKLVPHS